jgi:hypothetical protein
LHEVICDTSPLQYLHQLGLLDLLPRLVRGVVVPPAVDAELSVGRGLGLQLPDLSELGWLTIRRPASARPGGREGQRKSESREEWGLHDPKADIAASVSGSKPGAISTSGIPGVVEEGTAAQGTKGRQG